MTRKYPGMSHGNRQLVSMILIRQQGKCFYCQRDIIIGTNQSDADRKATLDHKIPLVFGGEAYGDNVVVACRRCNGSKCCLDADTYLTIRSDHKARKQAIRDMQAKIAAQTKEDRRNIHRLIKRTAKESRERLYLDLRPIVEEFKRNRATLAE